VGREQLLKEWPAITKYIQNLFGKFGAVGDQLSLDKFSALVKAGISSFASDPNGSKLLNPDD